MKHILNTVYDTDLKTKNLFEKRFPEIHTDIQKNNEFEFVNVKLTWKIICDLVYDFACSKSSTNHGIHRPPGQTPYRWPLFYTYEYLITCLIGGIDISPLIGCATDSEYTKKIYVYDGQHRLNKIIDYFFKNECFKTKLFRDSYHIVLKRLGLVVGSSVYTKELDALIAEMETLEKTEFTWNEVRSKQTYKNLSSQFHKNDIVNIQVLFKTEKGLRDILYQINHQTAPWSPFHTLNNLVISLHENYWNYVFAGGTYNTDWFNDTVKTAFPHIWKPHNRNFGRSMIIKDGEADKSNLQALYNGVVMSKIPGVLDEKNGSKIDKSIFSIEKNEVRKVSLCSTEKQFKQETFESHEIRLQNVDIFYKNKLKSFIKDVDDLKQDILAIFDWINHEILKPKNIYDAIYKVILDTIDSYEDIKSAKKEDSSGYYTIKKNLKSSSLKEMDVDIMVISYLVTYINLLKKSKTFKTYNECCEEFFFVYLDSFTDILSESKEVYEMIGESYEKRYPLIKKVCELTIKTLTS